MSKKVNNEPFSKRAALSIFLFIISRFLVCPKSLITHYFALSISSQIITILSQNAIFQHI
ncbi:hypothetical protein Q763_17390 [Flavobacterium beibuense F44-8]|uniref:Uncharacterized protein n=1 Tax=Flavobacterium beibuense F44-8 TaxID=1406840 RepID=A0A0A2LFN1_9FLAO|nr:hypothetical protein Q763_17390 [Flavobacterium beibuense F44-8]